MPSTLTNIERVEFAKSVAGIIFMLTLTNYSKKMFLFTPFVLIMFKKHPNISDSSFTK